jgi:hypothetical protein
MQEAEGRHTQGMSEQTSQAIKRGGRGRCVGNTDMAEKGLGGDLYYRLSGISIWKTEEGGLIEILVLYICYL